MIENYNESIQNKDIVISPCAYLHNYIKDSEIYNNTYQEYIDKAPMFFKYDVDKLRQFIKQRLRYGSKDDMKWLIEKGKLRTAKKIAYKL